MTKSVTEHLQGFRKTDNSRPLRPRSRSFKVIYFCCNRKPLCDFLLVINFHLSSIPHRFRDIATRSRKPPHPNLNLQIKRPPSKFVIKLTRQRVKALGYILVKLHDPMCNRFVTIHSRHRQTDRRQTDDRRHIYDNSRTLHCNGRLKTLKRQNTQKWISRCENKWQVFYRSRCISHLRDSMFLFTCPLAYRFIAYCTTGYRLVSIAWC